MFRQRKKARYPLKVVEGSAILLGARPYRTPPWRIWVRLLLSLLLLALGAEIFYISAGSHAVVRLTPATTFRESLISVLAVAQPSSREQSTVQQIRSSQSETVEIIATGSHLQPATAAHGTLIWYNASTTSQTIATHTRISVSAGLQLETDAPVTIPAANPPAPGQTEGPAHMLQAGQQGNIPANTLLDRVYGLGVTVSNPTPFVGGQNATPQSVFLQRDIDDAVTAKQSELAKQARDQLHRQAAEKQVIEKACGVQVRPDRPVGSFLPLHAQVSVTISVACAGLAYDQSDVQSKALASFRALTQPKGTYQLQRSQIRITNVNLKDDESLDISVRISGRWVYQISREARNALLSRIAGSSIQRAQEELEHFPGIEKAQLQCWWLWLPDQSHITLQEG